MGVMDLRRNILLNEPHIASAVGNPVAFSTDVKGFLQQAKVGFSPVQTGTGDPYPPGGGKNKFNPDAPIVTVVNSGGNNRSAIRLGLTNCTVTFSATAKTAGALPSYNINVGTYKNDVVVDTTGIISSSTGATTKTITFAADEEAILVYAVSNNTLFAEDFAKFNIQAEIGSSATSFMPYSNIRPISGWAGVNTWHTGKNLLNVETAVQGWVNGNGGISSGNENLSFDYMRCDTDEYFTFSMILPEGVSQITNVGIAYFDADKNIITREQGGRPNPFNFQFNQNIGATYARIWVNRDAIGHTKADWATFNIQLEPGKTATAYAPYTGNTFPAVFPELGKNLLNPATLEQGSILASSGTNDSSDYRVRTNGYIPLKSGQYTVSAVGVGQAMFFVYDNDKTYIKSESSSGFANLPRTLTLSADRNVRISFRVSDNNEAVTPSDVSNAQLESGSSATAFEPYITCYGGTLDLVTGVLTVEWQGWTGKWSEMAGSTDLTNVTRRAIEIGNVFKDADKPADKYCNIATYYYGYSADYVHFYVANVNNVGKIYVFLPIGADEDTTIQVYAKLAEPYTIQLSTQQITALVGTNTIWSDANGDATIKFWSH